MSEIHKIEKNGVTIYPATTTDAVVDAESREVLSKTLKRTKDNLLIPDGRLLPKSFVRTGNNLLNPKLCVSGKVINSSGEIVDNSQYSIFPYLEIEPSITYYGYGIGYLVFLDENYLPVSERLVLDNSSNTSPENARFALVAGYSTVINNAYFSTKPYDSSVYNRFFQTLSEAVKTDVGVWADTYPPVQAVIDSGIRKAILACYIDLEYDADYAYSILGINMDTKGVMIYRKPHDVIASQENIKLVLNFNVATQQGNSDLYLLTSSGSPKSWMILNNAAVKETITNRYDYDGLELSPKVFKYGIWHKLSLLQDVLSQIQEGVSLLQENITMINQIAGSNEDAISKLADKSINTEASVAAADYFANETITYNKVYNTSVFSGYGFRIGSVPGKFRYLYTRVFRSDWEISNDSGADITKVLVQIFQTTYDGEQLFSKLCNIPPVKKGEDKYITIDLEEDLQFSGELFINIRFNTYAVMFKGSSSTNPNFNGEKDGRYFSYGNITPTNTGQKVSGNGDTYATLFFKLFSSIEYKYNLTDEQIQDIESRINIPEPEDDSIKISLPDKIYAVVGDTLQLFYRGIIQAVNPYNYNILVSCSKGNQYPRYFEYTPTTSDVGTVTFTITVKDNNRNVIATKQCQLVTVDIVKSPASVLKVLCFGDSLTAAGTWPHEADRRLTMSGGMPSGKELTNIDFCGSLDANGTGYFGVGGWLWSSYTTEGRPAYRFQVTGVTSLTVGAVYTNNGNTFTIREVNVTEGSGNILCAVSNLTPAPEASGVLTSSSGTGDETITYSSVTQDSQNPLWDYEEEKMSFIPYANKVSNGQIDVVYTLLSWNGQTAGRTDFSTVINQIKVFADTLHSEFPNAKLKIMGVQVPSVRGGMGMNYGATGTSYADGYGMVVTALNQNDAYQEFANSEGYSDFVEFVNVSSQFDTDYNMPHNATKAVNVRNSTAVEWMDTNGVHPDTSGYYQIADVVYRNFIANFCQ